MIKKYIYSKLENIQKGQVKSNKTLLQEEVQKIHKSIPIYIDEPHEQDEKGNVLVYASRVIIDNHEIAVGYGTNKKKAQDEAAKLAYNILTNAVQRAEMKEQN